MECYFIVDTYIDENKGRGLYDEYIQKVKPIVEGFGGEYLVRSEQITSLHSLRKPQRVIIIRFPSRQALEACFASEAYQRIMKKRIESVDARALIVDEITVAELINDEDTENILSCQKGICAND